MRLTKEIEDQKNNEENLTQSLKARANECFRITYENDQLKLELTQSRNNGQELERQIIALRYKLATENEYKYKFNASSTRLDEMLESQRHGKDKRGLGFERGESSGSGQSNAKPNQKKSKNPSSANLMLINSMVDAYLQ